MRHGDFEENFFFWRREGWKVPPVLSLFTYVARLLQAVEAFFASIEQARFENFAIVVCT